MKRTIRFLPHILCEQLKKDLRKAKSIFIVSAIISKGGIDWMEHHLPYHVKDKTMVFGMFNKSTEHNSGNPDYARGRSWNVLINDNLHAKVLCIKTSSGYIIYTGSSNLSIPSLEREEMNVRYTCTNLPPSVNVLLKTQQQKNDFYVELEKTINGQLGNQRQSHSEEKHSQDFNYGEGQKW